MNIDESSEQVRELVRNGYGAIARGALEGRGGAGCGCCQGTERDSDRLARELGYTVEELRSLPEGANMGLSCGNPAALGALQPGETVLDLGAGGGFDVFIAGRKVGPTGRAIGVDMTPDMLARARRNTDHYRRSTGWDNVEFRLGEIEHLPVADSSVDVVVSNCVLNLSPNKPQVWREMARVLRPGGRVAVSDIALLQPLPPGVREMVESWVGCVAGAVPVRDITGFATQAGLEEVRVGTKPEYLAALEQLEDPLYCKIVARLPEGSRPSEYIASVDIQARKPGGRHPTR